MARPYELVVYGATGFTGKFISQHVVTSLPTDLRWAIAGRSVTKLQDLAAELKSQNPDRIQPAIEQCNLDQTELSALAAKTQVLITGVGPYAKYGTPVVEACINSGTHYFDVTGESPWFREMIKKYDQKAKERGVILIPQIGVDSVPADILTWALVSHIRNTLSKAVKDLTFTFYDMKAMPSGGTLASLMGIFDLYSASELRSAMSPFSLCPVQPSNSLQAAVKPSLKELLLGVRVVKDLGTLTTSLQRGPDTTQVYRSWGLLDSGKYYGDNFKFSHYQSVRNLFTGVLTHMFMLGGMIALAIPPVRALLKRFIYKPGEGPSAQSSRHDRIETRAIATADGADASEPNRAIGKFAWEGSMYHLTGVTAAEGAITLLRDETLAKKIGGGFLTPATLGSAYVNRLQKAGVRIEVRTMPV